MAKGFLKRGPLNKIKDMVEDLLKRKHNIDGVTEVDVEDGKTSRLVFVFHCIISDASSCIQSLKMDFKSFCSR